MDFNIAVERIGFTLAVLLYENALPENLWQVATTEQCFAFLRLHAESGFFKQANAGELILERIGSARPSKDIIGKVKERALAILADADFATTRRWYLFSDTLYWYDYQDWRRMSYDRMKALAKTFTEWRSIIETITKEYEQYCQVHPCATYDDMGKRHREKVRGLVQSAYPLAQSREDYVFLSNYPGPSKFKIGKETTETQGVLTAEQYVEVAEKVLCDNPTDEEFRRLGKRFPEDHAYYAKYLEIELQEALVGQNTWSELLRLYRGFDSSSLHQDVIASAILRELRAGSYDPQDGMYVIHDISDLASRYGNQEVANETFQFVVEHTEEVTYPGYLKSNCEWIVKWTDPGSEVHEKFKALLPPKKTRYGRGRPRTKTPVEV